jgi:DivIVA domain-containing protein
MGNIVLVLVVAIVFGAVVFGVMTLVTGGDSGLRPADPDSRARPLPADRPLVEGDVSNVTFDLAWRGYRMAQVDQTLRRLAYDLGYKTELIQVLEAEILALRDGRLEDADTLAQARISALSQKDVPAGVDVVESSVVEGPISAQLSTSTPAVVAQDDTVLDAPAAEQVDAAIEPVEPVEPVEPEQTEAVETDEPTDVEAGAEQVDAQADVRAELADAQDSDRPVASAARAGRSAR